MWLKLQWSNLTGPLFYYSLIYFFPTWTMTQPFTRKDRVRQNNLSEVKRENQPVSPNLLFFIKSSFFHDEGGGCVWGKKKSRGKHLKVWVCNTCWDFRCFHQSPVICMKDILTGIGSILAYRRPWVRVGSYGRKWWWQHLVAVGVPRVKAGWWSFFFSDFGSQNRFWGFGCVGKNDISAFR